MTATNEDGLTFLLYLNNKLLLLQSFEKELNALRNTNDINNRLVVAEIRTNYNTIMSNLCAKEPPLDENAFLEEHKKALADAIVTLDKKRNRASNYDDDSYKTEMSEVSNINSLEGFPHSILWNLLVTCEPQSKW